jgi:hypothetical protein
MWGASAIPVHPLGARKEGKSLVAPDWRQPMVQQGTHKTCNGNEHFDGCGCGFGIAGTNTRPNRSLAAIESTSPRTIRNITQNPYCCNICGARIYLGFLKGGKAHCRYIRTKHGYKNHKCRKPTTRGMGPNSKESNPWRTVVLTHLAREQNSGFGYVQLIVDDLFPDMNGLHRIILGEESHLRGPLVGRKLKGVDNIVELKQLGNVEPMVILLERVG